MSINLHSAPEYDPSYKLIQLTPELLDIIQDPVQNHQLRFKSLDKDKSEVVLCSHDKTWVLKQRKHSNTVLLMREFVPEQPITFDESLLFGLSKPYMDVVGFAKTESEFETREAHGELNLNSVPIYNGELDFFDKIMKRSSTKVIRTLEELLENSPCSALEGISKWHKIGGSVKDGVLCILSQDFLFKALHVLLMSAMAESLDLQHLNVEDTHHAVGKDIEDEFNPYTREIIETVLNKFAVQEQEAENNTWRLRIPFIAQWYGIQALRKYVSGISMPIDEFLIKWKSLFPPFFPCDIDIDMLRGYHFKPTDKTVQYIAKSTLPMDPKERFKVLFRLQSQWDLEDIKPLIEELNSRGMKIDSFIMKYARRKRLGKKTVVTSR
ncbi:XXYS1_4_G0053220.mRNA.1.CDS.1 [Saccharomyces cerevisiae]|nr:XXYS1_4_G0053220.mRNA.1.CDS.1 [Saccharomyces cerevisiae]CAD6604753.1 EM14S01-3B_G0050540.mRNA.1.CDS.1 [Saccharomyces cerevisiae]CAI4292205.1 AMH_1a_G0005360.mRNA.1.CDS.1 [Saccharomyces cerevisiae]CAI4297851.1 CEI_1a_G0005210.mRNA.1.CDS.1 [Saccharomyces cerevisiae]CAI6515226.1 AMH_1a_G0005360.mRNA.1.CDS.1 [Saccharomyces cerevisiae]